MKENDQTSGNNIAIGRRSLLTGVGVAAVTGLAASAASTSAQAQQGSGGFQPARHSKDAWMGELGGNHRVFVDSSTMPGGANALRYANNIMTAHEEDYEGEASDYAIIVCFRHTSTPYAFNDAIWAKYGGLLDRSADPAPTSNPMNVASRANGNNSIPMIVDKGAQFAICHRATRSFSRMLSSATGTAYDDIYAELLANAIPNSRFVAAGVLAATRAQEYGYSLLYAE
ncbi:MAG: hypothetical protein ACE37N_04215 [Pseudohongiellaceae bacterium]